MFCFRLLSRTCPPSFRSLPPLAIRHFSSSNPSRGVKCYNTDGPINFEVTFYKTQTPTEGEELRVDEEPHFLPASKTYGYNPLKIRDRLVQADGKKLIYEVVRKLGYGSSSSVWLVRSDEYVYVHYFAEAKTRYLAAKVLTVKSSIVPEPWDPDAPCELMSAIRICMENPKNPGYAHCIRFHDSFVCQSRHGYHSTFLFDAMGSDMATLQAKQPNRAFSSLVTKRIVKQVLLALDYIHRECDRVHTDVSLRNIMVALNTSDETIAEYLEKRPFETYEPLIFPSISPDPIITIKSQPLPDFGLVPSLDNLHVKLCDYGESEFSALFHRTRQTPCKAIVDVCTDSVSECQYIHRRAPEIILGHPWSTPVDIWSVGCITFELLVGAEYHLFGLIDDINPFDFLLEQLISHKDRFPSDFLEGCSKRDEYFDDNGALRRPLGIDVPSIEERLAELNVSFKDILPAATFIRRCLTLDPSVRPSASQLLQDDWLKDV
ncbi:kinase-like protein [Pholiota conissans]|uniref:non-specific serine/threonine protein kinase n=1 Tax=Pholiota conissans TaxID=109636 RepID=A0A9P5YLD5_9AGAR|nr:kinase-like protein [Pholiota conissans]